MARDELPDTAIGVRKKRNTSSSIKPGAMPSTLPPHPATVIQQKASRASPRPPPHPATVIHRQATSRPASHPAIVGRSHARTASGAAQCWVGDGWVPANRDATFRQTGAAAVAAERARAAEQGYQKGPPEARVDVNEQNTFAAYGELEFRNKDGLLTRVILGARLSGNPSNQGGSMYPDHGVRDNAFNYNFDCAEYYLVKRARRALTEIVYREGSPPRPTLRIFTEHSPCPRCQRDIDALQQTFGDLEVQVAYLLRYRAHEADAVWDFPNVNRAYFTMPAENPHVVSGRSVPADDDGKSEWQVQKRR